MSTISIYFLSHSVIIFSEALQEVMIAIKASTSQASFTKPAATKTSLCRRNGDTDYKVPQQAFRSQSLMKKKSNLSILKITFKKRQLNPALLIVNKLGKYFAFEITWNTFS